MNFLTKLKKTFQEDGMDNRAEAGRRGTSNRILLGERESLTLWWAGHSRKGA